MNNEEGILKDVDCIGRYCTKYGTAPLNIMWKYWWRVPLELQDTYYHFEKEGEQV